MKNYINLLIVICTVALFSFSARAEKMYGIFMVVKGSVKIKNASKQISDAKVGAKVYEGDSVSSGADSRAKIVMSDRNVFNVNPSTEFEIKKYQNDAASGKKEVEINLANGKIRSNVEQTYDGEKNKFEIKTPTAVAGVRGTQFLAGFNKALQMTSIVTFKGAVTLMTVNAAGHPVGPPVVVKKGETTSAAPNQPPAPPKSVPKEEIKKMDGESSVSMQNKSESSGKNREIASEGSTNNAGTSGSGGASSMVDSKDMDVNMAKDIKDVRNVANTAASSTPSAPKSTTSTDNSAINNVIRDMNGKTKVIVRPQPTN